MIVVMDEKFITHNRHRKESEQFAELDVHLAKLKHVNYVYTPPLLMQLPFDSPGLYTLSGGGLVGKTTLLKLWMNALLAKGVPATAIQYYAADFFTNHHALFQ